MATRFFTPSRNPAFLVGAAAAGFIIGLAVTGPHRVVRWDC